MSVPSNIQRTLSNTTCGLTIMPAHYFAYDGYGQIARESAHYSEAVRIGNLIECAGQGTTSYDAA